MEILNLIALYFIYFIFYSVVGYIWEVVWCSANAKDKKVKNRGYLFGPVCPIYGTGLVAVLIVTDWLKWPWWANFFLIIFICKNFPVLWIWRYGREVFLASFPCDRRLIL